MKTKTKKKAPGPQTPTRGQAHETVEPLLSAMGLRDAPVDKAALARVNTDFGRDLPELSEHAATAVDRCRAPFPDLVRGGVPSRMRARNQALEGLRRDKATFLAAAERTQEEINRLTVEQAEDARVVEQSIEATLMNPMMKRHHVPLSLAAQPLREGRAARRASIRTAIVAGQATRARLSDQETALAAAQDEIGRLSVENRYLSGEELRPKDLPLAARRAARRQPR